MQERCRGCELDPWVRKIPWRRAWQPTLVFLPGESLGERSLAGYSPWVAKNQDTTEQLNMHAQSSINRMAKMQNTGSSQGWGACGAAEALIQMQNDTDTSEDNLVVSYKTKHLLTVQHCNSSPWYLPKEVENLCPHRNSHTAAFTANFFLIAKTQKQPTCLLVGE